jgi:hypothetical protein
MKLFTQYFLPTTLVALLGAVSHAAAVQVEFDSPDYANGDLTNNIAWIGEGGNTVSNASPGYNGAVGIVSLDPVGLFTECIYTNPASLSVAGDTITLSSRFRYSTTGIGGSSNADLYSLMVYDDPALNTNGFVRLGLRRDSVTEQIRFFVAVGPGPVQTFTGTFAAETNVGLSLFTPGTTDWLEFTASLTKGTSSNSWILKGTVTNLVTTNQVLSDTFTSLGPLPTFQDDPLVYGAISSSSTEADSQTFSRSVDNFCINTSFTPLPVKIIGEGGGIGVASSGNGNFEADSGSPLRFAEVSNWHCLNGDDNAVNFGQTGGMGGSPEPNSQGGFLVWTTNSAFIAGNDTGYQILAAGASFDITLSVNKFGNAANYSGDEVVRASLFTSTVPVDTNTTPADITMLASTDLPIPGPFWTTESATGFYTASAADVGKTVYLSLELVNPTGTASLFPRLDVVQLSVTVPESCSNPDLAIVQNGANVDVSWFGDSGCDYQLQTNDTINGVWGNYGSVIAGGDSNSTVSIPILGTQLYIRAEAQ